MTQETNVYQCIKHENAANKAHIAIIYKNKVISYEELFRDVDKYAKLLNSYGISKGSRVALHCPDSIEYIIISLALLAQEAVLVPANWAMPESEINNLCVSIAAEFIISRCSINSNAHFTCNDSAFTVERLVPLKPAPDGIAELNPAFIRFTSGTTANSKGVIISHQGALERTAAADRGLQVNSGDTILWTLSMSYHFVVTILLFLRRGATIVICPEPVLLSMASCLAAHRITFLYATPYHYRIMTESQSFTPELMKAVRIAVSTAMPLDKSLADAFHAKFGFRLRQAYGIIEVGLPCISSDTNDFQNGLVGEILPDYELQLANQDKTGNGNIMLRGPGMFAGYFEPFRTLAQVCDNGWFDTGDVGHLDRQGRLVIAGRSKNVINFAGMKIFPYEVETVIRTFPDVEDVVMYGIPDSQYGELPCADVVFRNCAERETAVDRLKEFCYRQLAPYKTPKVFNPVNALETTLSGKNRRMKNF
ncbi:MAG: class I adenylate-forming enzyme family protein [Victivallaceae bacterium]